MKNRIIKLSLLVIIPLSTLFTSVTEAALHKTIPETTIATAPVGVRARTTHLVNSIGVRLVQFVHKTVETLSYNTYKFGGTHFDLLRGIYVLDCSTYVNSILKAVYPRAYNSLVNSSGTDKPTTLQYYDFFTQLPDTATHGWGKVDEVGELQAGDILVFRSKARSSRGSGHVMVVMDKPVRSAGSYLVRIADSAPSGHSLDTRQPHSSGIGIGTLVLQANPKTGEPSAYAWKIGSYWIRNVHFAMARPGAIGFI